MSAALTHAVMKMGYHRAAAGPGDVAATWYEVASGDSPLQEVGAEDHSRSFLSGGRTHHRARCASPIRVSRWLICREWSLHAMSEQSLHRRRGVMSTRARRCVRISLRHRPPSTTRRSRGSTIRRGTTAAGAVEGGRGGIGALVGAACASARDKAAASPVPRATAMIS